MCWAAGSLSIASREVSGARPRLRKSIGGLGFFSLAFGSMIGVGWITALGGWFEQAGPIGAIVAFVAGGLLMLVIGLCYAEVTPMLPVSGGEVAYASKAYGTSKAFLIGWFLAFGYLSVSAFEAISIGTVLAYMFPAIDAWPLYDVGGSTVYGAHLLLALVFTAFITFINYVGVGVATRVQVVLTLALLACTVTFVVAGIWGGDVANLEPWFGGAAVSGSATQPANAVIESASAAPGPCCAAFWRYSSRHRFGSWVSTRFRKPPRSGATISRCARWESISCWRSPARRCFTSRSFWAPG